MKWAAFLGLLGLQHKNCVKCNNERLSMCLLISCLDIGLIPQKCSMLPTHSCLIISQDYLTVNDLRNNCILDLHWIKGEYVCCCFVCVCVCVCGWVRKREGRNIHLTNVVWDFLKAVLETYVILPPWYQTFSALNTLHMFNSFSTLRSILITFFINLSTLLIDYY